MRKDGLGSINDLIHAKARLGIMSMVMTYEYCDFTMLKEKLRLTDGNLGAHIQKLEEAQYIITKKTFLGRKPKTYVSVTEEGREAYREYIATLEAVLYGEIFHEGEGDK
ncbi:winged helix-turn-helix domain-containing protein [Shouchella lonarensis]|uniref:Winged helix DNA-binding domain-containing protein n=1 Tax=Shouchella lonarensis TaxID=1464122 RepID=A0A1G6MWD3_9BACI|nr:transcriptional regulator [Shouchella lonarensis]SDC59751.1 Winged helix DNA-binding domain-containing protein [Shouchella lonarensis]